MVPRVPSIELLPETGVPPDVVICEAGVQPSRSWPGRASAPGSKCITCWPVPQFRVHALVLDGKAVRSRPRLIDRLGCITKNERGASTLADILAVL